MLNFKDLQIILTAGIILILLDMIYLYFNKKDFEVIIASVQRVSIQPKYFGMVICYIFLILGLYWFILRKKAPVLDAVLFGFVIYGVFETTNFCIFKKWNWFTVVKDTLWGGALMGITTSIVYAL